MITRNMLTVALFSVTIAASPASATCTIEEIKSCAKSEPEAAVKVLEREYSHDKDPSWLTKLGQIYEGPTDLENRGRAFSYYEQAAAGGDAWGMVLLADLLVEDGGKRNRMRARQLLTTALEEKKLTYAYASLIALEVEDYKSASAVASATALLKRAYTADPELGVNALYWLPDNSKVAVIQSILLRMSVYRGKVDGRLTKETLRAIGQFCRRNNVKECRKEAMPLELLRRLMAEQ